MLKDSVSIPDPIEVWDSVRLILSKKIDPAEFNLWILPIKNVEIIESGDDSSIFQFVIKVPSRIFSDWIEQNSLEMIRDALRSCCHLNIEICLIIEPVLSTVASEDVTTKEHVRIPIASVDMKDDIFVNNQSTQPFNPEYTFENFIECPSNRFTKAISEQVALAPGENYNPLLIYGQVGLGKTHLIHAIGQFILTKHKHISVMYASSERFINDFITALRTNNLSRFRNAYRKQDCLLIDDIQFLMSKERSEEEFFFTFNALFDLQKQIVISSDRAPSKMHSLQNRLISRLQGGIVTEIQSPQMEDRIAILKSKIELHAQKIPEDMIIFLAENVQKNIRELEGAVSKLFAYTELTKIPLSVDVAKMVLKDILHTRSNSTISIEDIQVAVSKSFNISLQDIKSKKRTDAISWPRQIAMYLTRELTNNTTTEIAKNFSKLDHTTVVHACKKIKQKLSQDPFIASFINRIVQEIQDK